MTPTWVWISLAFLSLAAFLCLPFRRLPDASLLLVGFGLYALAGHSLPGPFWIAVGFMILLAGLMDLIMYRWGKRVQPSRATCWVAVLGLICLAPFLQFFLGPFAPLVAPFLAAVAFECWGKKTRLEESMRRGLGATFTFALPLFFKACLMVGMVIFFLFLALGINTQCISWDENGPHFDAENCQLTDPKNCQRLYDYGLDRFFTIECHENGMRIDSRP